MDKTFNKCEDTGKLAFRKLELDMVLDGAEVREAQSIELFGVDEQHIETVIARFNKAYDALVFLGIVVGAFCICTNVSSGIEYLGHVHAVYLEPMPKRSK